MSAGGFWRRGRAGPEPEYDTLLTPSGLRSLSAHAYGLGPHYSQLVAAEKGPPRRAELAQRAHDAGLRLHAYTFRRDDLPPFARTIEDLLELAFAAGFPLAPGRDALVLGVGPGLSLELVLLANDA